MSDCGCRPTIKRGDAYNMAVVLILSGEEVKEEDLDMLQAVEFMVGDRIRKVYPEEVLFGDGAFLVPLTQEETFDLEAGVGLPVDVRVHFAGGDVLGMKKVLTLRVVDSLSEVVL